MVTGYSALRFHDYRTDPEHPPFIRMWAALPLLAMDNVKVDLQRIDAVDPVAWAGGDQFFFCHEMLYVANDADHLLYQARFMVVLLGVLLGVLLFCWTRELFGFWPAVIVLGLYTIEPNLLAHARLVTTDFGVTCFIFGTLYFLWRTTRRLTPANVGGLLGFFVLAQISKFSALLLGPIVLALLLARVCQKAPWPTSLDQRAAVDGLLNCSRAGLVVARFGDGAATWASIFGIYLRTRPPGAGVSMRIPASFNALPCLPRRSRGLMNISYCRMPTPKVFFSDRSRHRNGVAFLRGVTVSTGGGIFSRWRFSLKPPSR